MAEHSGPLVREPSVEAHRGWWFWYTLTMKPLIFVVFVVFLAACTSSNRADTKDGPMSDPPGEDDVDQDGYSIEQGDCDDADPDVNPGAEDSTVDGVDQDCDDLDGPDADGDG